MKVVTGLVLFALIATALSQEPAEEGERWAVLLASSHKWVHYRHQASICHAYQVLHSQGLQDDHIVVIMYDDIAYASENPYPGVITDVPGGPNVYEGVPVDYKGSHVTPTTFLKALEGDETGMADIGSGKVVKSGPNDRIFVVMVDGGGIDHFAFPYTILSASKLHTHITQMKADNKFNELMIFIESSNSGSMILKRYPDEMGVYAMTSTGEFGNSFAMYWSEELGTWMADTYTLAWMTNSEENDPTKQTIGEQFNTVKEWVRTSEVHSYGNMSIQQEFVSAFFGPGKANYTSGTSSSVMKAAQKDVVSSAKAPIVYLENHMKSAKSEEERAYWEEKLTTLKRNRRFMVRTMKKIAMEVVGDLEKVKSFILRRPVRNVAPDADIRECYDQAVQAFHDNCFNLGENHYGLRLLGTLWNVCANGYNVQHIIAASKRECNFPKFTDID